MAMPEEVECRLHIWGQFLRIREWQNLLADPQGGPEWNKVMYQYQSEFLSAAILVIKIDMSSNLAQKNDT